MVSLDLNHCFPRWFLKTLIDPSVSENWISWIMTPVKGIWKYVERSIHASMCTDNRRQNNEFGCNLTSVFTCIVWKHGSGAGWWVKYKFPAQSEQRSVAQWYELCLMGQRLLVQIPARSSGTEGSVSVWCERLESQLWVIQSPLQENCRLSVEPGYFFI